MQNCIFSANNAWRIRALSNSIDIHIEKKIQWDEYDFNWIKCFLGGKKKNHTYKNYTLKRL